MFLHSVALDPLQPAGENVVDSGSQKSFLPPANLKLSSRGSGLELSTTNESSIGTFCTRLTVSWKVFLCLEVYGLIFNWQTAISDWWLTSWVIAFHDKVQFPCFLMCRQWPTAFVGVLGHGKFPLLPAHILQPLYEAHILRKANDQIVLTSKWTPAYVRAN